MAIINNIFYYSFHVQELRKMWHEPVHEREEDKETPNQKECYKYLEMTSRSFSIVIQELHPELLLPVALFYLVLRGLDTIEDDMTIDSAEKDRLLRDFHNILDKEGWTYNGNGPNEKDRELLVHFDVVVEEFAQVKPPYRTIIKDITKKMGNGMADYARKAAKSIDSIDTVKDYNLYCHYVAGLVGEGLTRLFVESGLANPVLLDRTHLHESMGLFLQKTNIIRDIREDWEDQRRFWPREIWSKHVDKFDDLFDPKNADKALNCSSDMVLNALNHADECLFYLAGIKEQSVFNFAAIPQSMAIATLELVFRNPQVFKKNVKITRGHACKLMTDSSQNLRTVCDSFRKYVRLIHAKNTPTDPNFLSISIACGKVEAFIESIFPSQNAEHLVIEQKGEEIDPRQAALDREAKKDVIYLMGAVFLVLIVLSGIMIGLAIYFGAQFGNASKEVAKGNLVPGQVKSQSAGHGEL
ncbi:MAG: hypothetical protein M4579_005795 [Chaenotheca gracillima]|nr:MAG: hypothetical protein M4579_005795 [Chaenotheca gracillima]